MGSFKNNIPKSWTYTSIGEAYEVIGGGTPSTEKPEFWGGDIPWITSADIEGVRQIAVRKYVTEKGIAGSTTSKVPPRTLLVVTRVGLGKIAISDAPICFSQDLQGLVQKPELICPEYTLHLLSYELQILKFEGRGTTISGVTKKQLKDLGFPLPPINEQKRIVAKIEELFSELDKGIESFKTVREQLKAYRQALLKHAFEGKLTADWREENKDKLEPADALLKRIQAERAERYRQQVKEWEKATKAWEKGGKQGCKPGKPSQPKQLSPLTAEELSELPGLPDGWGWGKLGLMTCGVEYGTSAKSAEVGTIPVLRMGNIQNLRFDWDDLVFTSDSDEIAKYSLTPGDVLFNRTNSPELVGKSAIYKGEMDAIFAGYLIRINQIESITSGQFLNLFLNSAIAKQHGNKVKTDGVNQSNINGNKLINYPFPFCSVSEQHEIIAVLDEKLSVADNIDENFTTALQQAETLRQSILKKAFSGQLVPQDPHDEPAAELLARIKAEKEKTAMASKQAKTVKTTKTKAPKPSKTTRKKVNK